MQELIDKLILILRAEFAIYSEILELSKLKKGIIADGKIDELDNIIKNEQIFLVRITDHEQKRMKLIDTISKTVPLYKKNISINDIIKICDDKRAAALKDITGKLSETLKNQINYNEINRKMISDRLEYINFMLSNSKGVMEQTNNYGAGGVLPSATKEQKKSSIIDSKA